MHTRKLIVPVGASLMACLALAAQPSGTAATDLVLRYSFDTDSTTLVNDSSANNLDGRLVNASPSTAFVTGAPRRGKGLQLVASKRQYVALPQRGVLDVNRYTIAAWIRYTGVTTSLTLGRWEVLEKAGAYWLNVRTNGRLRAGGFYGGCVDSRYWKYLDSTRIIAKNTWTHVASTYNGSKLTIYVNGLWSGAMNITGTTCANDEPLAVGAKNAPAENGLEAFWDGRLDEVRVYNRPLTQAEIAALAS